RARLGVDPDTPPGDVARFEPVEAAGARLAADQLPRADDLAAASLGGELVAQAVGDLAAGDDHQQPPQVVPVVEARVGAAAQPAAEAVEGAEGGVALAADPARRELGREVLAGQRGEPLTVALPEVLGRRVAAVPQVADPDRDRSRLVRAGHGPPPPPAAVASLE